MDIVFTINVMNGGGAERVTALLANFFQRKGYRTSILLTNQSKSKANLCHLDNTISVISVEDEIKKTRYFYGTLSYLIYRISAKFLSVFSKNQDVYMVKKYSVRNYRKVQWMHDYFNKNNHAVIIAFLYEAIFLSLLSRTKKNRLIISERADPGQFLGSKIAMAFFRLMFSKADAWVFQSPDARQWYRDNIGIDGTVIFNPVSCNLPLPYKGIRKKRIVNFCRISSQKNLCLLIEAFEYLCLDYPNYELWIYGNPDSSEPEYVRMFYERVEASSCRNAIHVEPACADIHNRILDSTLFVSSSDFEGMSNSMLEAMAIGLPVICTDCPAGGARAVIRDHENGLLVPIKDKHKLYLAMKELIENPVLANHMSLNASKIRQCQAEENIMQEWQKLI